MGHCDKSIVIGSNPILATMDIKEHFNSVEKLDCITGYEERPVDWWISNILPDLLEIKEKLNLGPKILDIGCASGYFSFIISQHFTEVTAIDFAESRIELAKKYNSSENLNYQVLDIVNEKIIGTYDSAISSAVFQHMNPFNGDRIKAFENTFESIKKQGYLILYDESYFARRVEWDGFYSPLDKSWIVDKIGHLCDLESYEFVAKGLHGEYEFRWVLRKK